VNRCDACSEAEAEVINGLADSVEQSGASPRLVGIVGERHNFLRWDGANRHEVFVVEQDEGEFGESFGLLLIRKKLVEPGDGGLLANFHGAGAIEDKSDLGVMSVWFHSNTLQQWVGHRLS
jgi:hypothetical protein